VAVIGLAVLLGEVYVIAGILLAAVTRTLPVSFFVATLSFIAFVLARLLQKGRAWAR
jgi:zinc/manganese transport system permease protein